MKIALLNNQYFMVGGTTRYLFNVKRLLESYGNTVVPFSNRYPETVETEYAHYFPLPPGGKDATVFFGDAPMTWRRAWGLFVRGIYDWSVRRKLERMLRAESIDLVYSINICNFLGPSVIDAARALHVPYVMRLSDFNLICPAYLHLRDGMACEECVHGLWHAVQHRCLQDSVPVSLARVIAMWAHRATGVYERVSRIVTPSAFLRTKLIASGWDEDRIDHIPSFVDLERFQPSSTRDGSIVFSGRLAPEKGPETLIRAAALLPNRSRVRIVLMGAGEPGYVTRLKELATQLAPNRVEFAGQLTTGEMVLRLRTATALAHPARSFENMPNSITEAMALGKPILASDLGSLPEQVDHDRTGLLLDPNDPEAWSTAIDRLTSDSDLAERMGNAGRQKAEEQYAPKLHYERLRKTFKAACSRTRAMR